MTVNVLPKILNCRGRLLDVNRAQIMGILNITPDSFYDGGRFSNIGLCDKRVAEMITEGMDILDIGAYSSRPGAVDISLEEEWKRLQPVLDLILKKYSQLFVSIDTFRSEIARRAIEDYGVGIINDISGALMDDKMPELAASLNVPYILMHMKGSPQTMQNNPAYDDVLEEIMVYFIERIARLKGAGVKDIIIDPGFGFGKTLDQNYFLLNKLDQFKIFEKCILVGVSRKSMIYKFLNQKPAEALTGTITLQTIALQKGAGILRVHDVKAAVECRNLFDKVNKSNN